MSMEDTPRSRRPVSGVILIFVGLALFVLRFVHGLDESIVLVALGSAFLAGYFYRRVYGLLIPGCILLGLGVGGMTGGARFGVEHWEEIGLGVGFVAIFLIDLAVRGQMNWWPLIPGLILIVGPVASAHVNFGRIVSYGWPLILVVAGLLILTGRFGRYRER
jgi:hypothetical protein